VVGDTGLASNEIVLVSGDRSKNGAVWWRDQVLISNYWIANFSFRVTCGTLCGQGFTLTFQRSSAEAIGDCSTFAGWCHGYLDINPSFSVIFNVASEPEIAFAVDGANPPTNSEIPSSFKFGDGQWHSGSVFFDYNRRKVDVYIDGVLQTSAVFGDSMRDTLGFGSVGQKAWIGFTARSAFAETSRIEISNWNYSSSTTSPMYSQTQESGQLIAAPGDQFNMTVLSLDSCKHARVSGGDSWSVRFEGESFQSDYIPAVDLQDGSYAVLYSIPIAGDYIVKGLCNAQNASILLGSVKIGSV